MDHELEKQKHSKRLQQKQNHVVKQTRILKQYGVPNEEPHRLAKRHALNCGNPKCLMCGNPRKMWHEMTVQERKHFQEMEIVRARHSNGIVVDEIEVYLNVRNGE